VGQTSGLPVAGTAGPSVQLDVAATGLLGTVTVHVNWECTGMAANLVERYGNACVPVPVHSRSLVFIRGFTPEQLRGINDSGDKGSDKGSDKG
jgi:hypothetical protein